MNRIDDKQMQSIFINNTSFILSSVFDLFSKVFYNDKDSVKLKNNLNDYFRFTIAVKNNEKSYRMLFIISKDENHLQLLIRSPIVSNLYDGAEFFGDGKFSLLTDFWYNFAAIYMFSFLDSIDCIGGSSIYNDLPIEISQKECLTYFASHSIPIVMGMDTVSNSSANYGIITYVGMLS